MGGTRFCLNAPPFYIVITYCPPGRPVVPLGVLLLVAQDTLLMRFREDWRSLDSEDLDIIPELVAEIPKLAKELGPEALIAHFEGTLSNVLQVSERRPIPMQDLSLALDHVYSQEIGFR